MALLKAIRMFTSRVSDLKRRSHVMTTRYPLQNPKRFRTMNASATYSPAAKVDGVSLLASLADFLSKSETMNAHDPFSTSPSLSGTKSNVSTSSILHANIYQAPNEQKITDVPKATLDIKRRPAKKRAMPPDFHFDTKEAGKIAAVAVDALNPFLAADVSNAVVSKSLPVPSRVKSIAITQSKSNVSKDSAVSSPNSSIPISRTSANKAKTSSKSAKNKKSSNVDPPPSFPTVLMAILSSPQTNADAISFLSDDQRFIVVSPVILEKRVLPQYFGEFRDKSLKVTSFIKFEFMLRLWGFRRESDPKYPQINVWKHEMFKKGDWETCLKIKRPSQDQVQDFHGLDAGVIAHTLRSPHTSNDFISQEAEIIALKAKLAHLRQLQSTAMGAHRNSSKTSSTGGHNFSIFPTRLGMTVDANAANFLANFNLRAQTNGICFPGQSNEGLPLRRSSLLAYNAINENVSSVLGSNTGNHFSLGRFSRRYPSSGAATAAKTLPSDVDVRFTTNEVVSAALAVLKNGSAEGVPPPTTGVAISAPRKKAFPPSRRHTIDTPSNTLSRATLNDSCAAKMMFRNKYSL
mmetsp:Transcript_30774/g.61380  ORF Transcript_30774/g.61380 Transcript_30774/m.61380 type:complete len:576 (+) Transcript_30774:100-1827(+)